MQFLGTDTDFRPQTKLKTIVSGLRRYDKRCSIHLLQEGPGVSMILSNNPFGVVRAILRDVFCLLDTFTTLMAMIGAKPVAQSLSVAS